MSERKNKRGTENIVEEGSEEMTFIVEPTRVEIGSGYTVAFSYDEGEKPIIDVKTYGQVDIVQLRRDIARAFPNAQIRRLNQTGSVTVTKAKKRRGKTKKK
jgi:hypothetical protein